MTHLAYLEDLPEQACEAAGNNGGDAPVTPTYTNGPGRDFGDTRCGYKPVEHPVDLRAQVTPNVTCELKVEVSPAMIRGLDYAFLQVRGFHQVMGQPAPNEPTLQPYEHVTRRGKWIISEVDELVDPAKQTIVDQADAYLDIIYFALGGLVEIGILPQSLMDIVNDANMAKVWPDGSVRRREDGKIIKPDGWVAPEPQLAAEVHRQVKHRLLSALTA